MFLLYLVGESKVLNYIIFSALTGSILRVIIVYNVINNVKLVNLNHQIVYNVKLKTTETRLLAAHVPPTTMIL